MSLLEVALGFSVGYVYASCLESYFHDKVNDAPKTRVDDWGKYPWIRAPPWPICWFARTSYFRFIARHHFLHHRYCRYNFNLVLGGDVWRGKYRRPSDRDWKEMKRLGLE